jgi:hypothetical protein
VRWTVVVVGAAMGCGRPTSTTTPTSTSCGADCRQYDSVGDAFLDEFLDAIVGNPRVIGIGEAHAPKGATAASAAKRFTADLLPLLEGKASDLLLELMMPPAGCADAAAQVKKKQQVVPTLKNFGA